MSVVLEAQRATRSHAPADAFCAYLARMGVSTYARRCLLATRRRFVKQYPDLEEWFAIPLALRVGRLGRRPTPAILSDLRSYQARPYLLFLALFTSGGQRLTVRVNP